MTPSVSLASHLCEAYIPFNDTKTFAVAPVGELDVCYFPNGRGGVTLGAVISLWDFWDNQEPPAVAVDIYYARSTNHNEHWTYLYTIDARPWWRYSPTLWLTEGVYIFRISTSRYAQISLWVGY
jgi:hypothetical protein